MKIPDIKSIISIAQSTAPARKAQQADEQRKAQTVADSVELSAQSRQQAELAALRTGDSGRTAEVALLKEQYENGQYQVDPQAVAEAMISEGLFDDLIGSKHTGKA